MSSTSQKKALKSYRKRLKQRGMRRFEVLGLESDRQLLRLLAKRLAENDSQAVHIRTTVRRTISGQPSATGGILNALRRSPLVDADLDLTRPAATGRKVEM